MNTGIISYGAGNGRSVQFALERLGAAAFISDDPARLADADRVIFPGVGAAAHAMRGLQNRGLDQFIRAYEKPFLGICLGMQLLCEFSEEGAVPCLGIFPAQVKRFTGVGKVPHTGWNTLEEVSGPLFVGLVNGASCYYVHSYFVSRCSNTVATTSYNGDFSAGIQCRNFYGLQFHPEKSGATGERILQNFLAL